MAWRRKTGLSASSILRLERRPHRRRLLGQEVAVVEEERMVEGEERCRCSVLNLCRVLAAVEEEVNQVVQEEHRLSVVGLPRR